jgi:hypothetical protein
VETIHGAAPDANYARLRTEIESVLNQK